MNRILILLTTLAIAAACGRSDQHAHDEDQRGPHNGRLLEQDGFAVELAIFEAGIPPEYRVWFYEDDKPLPASAATVEVELQRLGGKRDRFTFRPEGDYLRGSGVVEEPHSFDVTVRAQREGKAFEWKFESYEGRTTIAADTAQVMGIATREAGPALLKEQLTLSGVIQADPARVSRVRARYAGIVREVEIGRAHV